jgi:uncharacterized protein (TIGR03663 family)
MLSIKNMTLTKRWIPILIVAFTAVFRLWFLTIKPPHFDEGVNGWFLDEMGRQGYYQYDPANYHGPLHFYILFFFKVLLGRNLWALRLPVAIVSTLTVYLVTLFDRFIDRRTCWLAALCMAVSPGMEFYGRYAIHESEMVLFLILLVWGALGISKIGTREYLWAAMLGATGMILTKETYVIHLTAFLLALVCLWILEKFLPSSGTQSPQPKPYPVPELCKVGAVSAGLILFFYSGTFLDFPALKGIYLTFGEWVKTGKAGNGHEKPAIYWLTLILRYEWPVLPGMLASFLYIWPKNNRFIRYIMIYGWGTLVAYSIIHYKTPWCVITLIWPFFFVFGEFAKDLSEKIGNRAACVSVAILLAAWLAWSVRLNFIHYTDEDEPYVYVQTFKDIEKLTGPLFKLVARDPSSYHMKGLIILSSYHPLPWVLGDFTDIGYYDKEDLPKDLDADFLLVEGSRTGEVENALKQDYFTEDLRLRGSMDPSKLYLNCKRFRVLFPDRKPDFTPGKPATGDTSPDMDEDQ